MVLPLPTLRRESTVTYVRDWTRSECAYTRVRPKGGLFPVGSRTFLRDSNDLSLGDGRGRKPTFGVRRREGRTAKRLDRALGLIPSAGAQHVILRDRVLRMNHDENSTTPCIINTFDNQMSKYEAHLVGRP